ncbi:MAG: hypothetical protein Q2306_02080 [Phytoplasma sp.]|uniref:hypothetical protein n=1 Tax=Phytoplasma sp. TaxID=2155 RepID=UPI002B410D53|nr:hypothetical protein [Phytoplasma sp.]WRH06663.1 MAG: hypothetical protein Q2306_02080 [Phytoplasma sp.]
MLTYQESPQPIRDKKHEFSFGNLRDAICQKAELYMDVFGRLDMLRAAGWWNN